MIRAVHVNDKLSMDGLNPSSVAHLLGDWIPRLEDRGIACSVCTLRDPDPGAEYLGRLSIPVHQFGHGRYSFRNLGAIGGLLRSESADIAHLHGFGAANYGRVAARRLGIANVVHEHATLKMPAHQRLADRALRGWTDAAVAVSGSVREFMIHDRSIPPERIEVIGNGVDVGRFANIPPAAAPSLKNELGIPEADRVVGTVTRLRTEKGTEHFVRAAARVLDAVTSVTFVVAGEGPLREPLEELARHLKLDRRMLFLGFREDVPALLGLLDVLVIPSLTEGFPLSLVEGMAAARPIVATRVGGMPEVARDGEDVLFVPPRDPDAIARRTIELLEDAQLAARLGRQAVQTAAGYSVDRSAARLADLYARLLRRHRSAAKPHA